MLTNNKNDSTLIDTGWKKVLGTGALQVLEEIIVNSDARMRVFARTFGVTVAKEWYIRIQSEPGATFVVESAWEKRSDKTLAPVSGTSELDTAAEYELTNRELIHSAVAPNNVNGVPVQAGDFITFESSANAISTDGIMYRIVVEKETGLDLMRS